MAKVLILISHMGSFGGTHRVAIGLANRLVRDHEVHLAAVYNAQEQLFFPLDERIQTTTFLPTEDRLRKMAMALRKPFTAYLKSKAIDIVLLIGNYQGFVALPTTLTYRKTAYVFCDHGALMNQWDARSIRTMRRWCARFCDAVVTLTQQSRQDYIERFNLDPSRVRSIYNWIDPVLFERPVRYDSATKTIMWAGRLDREKGVDLLLEIAGKTLPAHPDWQWSVFGSGDDEADFVAGVNEQGLGKQLVLKGHTDDLYGEYAKSGIVTLTSYREGLPLVLLEGKAFGLPLVSFDVATGPAEIIRDGEDGFLIECFDTDSYARKLGELMDDATLRSTMSARSHENIDKFSPDAIYAQWLDLIEELTA